jgi:hypothetical protein
MDNKMPVASLEDFRNKYGKNAEKVDALFAEIVQSRETVQSNAAFAERLGILFADIEAVCRFEEVAPQNEEKQKQPGWYPGLSVEESEQLDADYEAFRNAEKRK